MTPEKYPWYDARYTPYQNPRAEDDDPADDFDPYEEEEQPPAQRKLETPREIYDRLSSRILKQEEEKRCASMVVYNALRGQSEHTFFIGPSGSGKTAIWRAMQELYPDMIEIFDGSRLTMEGWKGDYKVADMLKSDTMLRTTGNIILVVDEADKTFAGRESAGRENVGSMLAAEFLKLMDGIVIPTVSNKTTHYVDTSRISFVFCGAFSSTANLIAEKNGRKQICFGDVQSIAAKPYDREITKEDLIEHGVLPELIGRVIPRQLTAGRGALGRQKARLLCSRAPRRWRGDLWFAGLQRQFSNLQRQTEPRPLLRRAAIAKFRQIYDEPLYPAPSCSPPS